MHHRHEVCRNLLYKQTTIVLVYVTMEHEDEKEIGQELI